MKVYMIPQTNVHLKLEFAFEGSVITVSEYKRHYKEIGGSGREQKEVLFGLLKEEGLEIEETLTLNVVDVFDFSGLAEGDLLEDIETTLTINPILEAEVRGSELYVQILDFYGPFDEIPDVFTPEWRSV